MLTSLESNDMIGMLDHLAPGERDVLRDATLDYLDELKRLGVISEGMQPTNVPGFEADFENMIYDVTAANAKVSLVEVTGGEVTLGMNVAALPLGKMLVERLGPLPDEPLETVTIDIATELEGAEAPPRIGVVEVAGRFYVSAFYTAAETAAAEAGYTMPSTPIPAVGATTPEGAVVEMVEAGFDLDVARVIELTPPNEMAALHDYGSILVELADDAMAEAGNPLETEGLTITLDDYRFERVPVSGGTKLLPAHIALSIDSEQEGRFTFSATKVDETCVEYEFALTPRYEGVAENESGRYCAADVYEAFEGSVIPMEVQQIAERLLVQLGQLGIVTVEVDGARYVSPTRSSTDMLLVALQGPERGDIETLLDWAMEEFSFDMDDLDDIEIIDDPDVDDIDDKGDVVG